MPKIRVEKFTREEIMKGVVRHADLPSGEDGFFDGHLPRLQRKAYSYLHFSRPSDEQLISPAGENESNHVAHLDTGFGLGLIAAKPGNGVPFHNHDRIETFMCLGGSWRLAWQGADGEDEVILQKYDLVAFPPHVHRRFENVTADEGKEEGMLLATISGAGAGTEFAPEVLKMFRDNGITHPVVEMQLAALDDEPTT